MIILKRSNNLSITKIKQYIMTVEDVTDNTNSREDMKWM